MELIITEKLKLNGPSICLNMIVKNESHIIRGTLEKLCSKIKFSYWVICDTGSTDNTREIITEFFKTNNIPGELHKDEWQNFAYNRTIALERAFEKTDLLLIFDADDEIVGNIEMPGINNIIYDEYHLKFGSPLGTAYTRVLLVNNSKKFAYQSVIHEYICCLDPNGSTNTIIQGDYYVVSGRSGNRSLDPEKYLKDAKILEAAHAVAVKENDPLYKRYAFYCANSYKDYGSLEEAIKWYKITLSQDNWEQEQFTSCLYIYECYQKLQNLEQGFFYLVKAFKYDLERVECLYPLLVHYCCEDQHRIAYNYYLQVKDFFETRYLNTNMDKKLFITIDKYNFYVPYYMILIADKVRDFVCVVKMFEIIFTKKMPISDIWYIKNFLYNLQFFVQHVKPENKDQFNALANEYIRFLYDLGIPLNTLDFLKDYNVRFGLDVSYLFTKTMIDKKGGFSKNECANSKNILFYTGFADVEWNYSYVKNNALGGSEKAVAYLSYSLSKELVNNLSKSYNVYVAGVVQSESFDNVTYVKLHDIHSLIKKVPFNTVICSRYISFLEMFKECSFDKFYIWGHDTLLLPYGSELNEKQIITKWDQYITGCICQTEWHANLFKGLYPKLTNKITIINNGIDIDQFISETGISETLIARKKQSNKFIYSSRPERGLDKLLELWPQILDVLPDAELVISNYGINPETKLMDIIQTYKSIKYLGKLNTEQLYKEMGTSEYWLYPTSWPETSCITALEMLMSEVICLYYPVAGLPFTIKDHGIQVKPGNEIEQLINLTTKKKDDIKEKGKKYALSCSWKNRAKEWVNVLFLNENEKKKNIVFYVSENFILTPLIDYFDSFKETYHISYTSNINTLNELSNTIILFVLYNLDLNLNSLINDKNNEIGVFNTEPLNIQYNLINCIHFHQANPNINFYDYSKSNIDILNKNNISNTIYLPYIKTKLENEYLTKMRDKTIKQYDFGIIGNHSYKSTTIDTLTPRRKKIVKFLLKNNYSVNIVNGWKNERDSGLSKCKIILNIHGQIVEKDDPLKEECSNIFEHLRCNRLLDAGFNILSEESYCLDPNFIEENGKNLQIINYDDFFNLETYINMDLIKNKNNDKDIQKDGIRNSNTIGFIILRYVNNAETNKYWQHCYDCIRQFYPENLILIIDDFSNYDYISEKELYKTTIINSEFSGRGNLLQYYYYLKNKLFDTAVIFHDTVFLNTYIDFTVDKYKIIWNFNHVWDQIEDETNIINLFNDPELLTFYNDKSLWDGCFGGMSIITHDYLTFINSKYNFDLLLNAVLNKHNCSSFERVIGCLLCKNYTTETLFGDIHAYCNWGITFSEKENFHLPIVKVW